MTTYLLPVTGGTISIASGAKAVAGTGTLFLASAVMPGDVLQIGNSMFAVGNTAAITNTGFELVDAFTGYINASGVWVAGAASGVAYKIHRVSPGHGDVANLTTMIADLMVAVQTGCAFGSSAVLDLSAGDKVLVVPSGLPILPGALVRLTSRAAPTTDYMVGTLTAYAGTSMTITVAAIDVSGSGTRSDWNFNITGLRGPQGPAGTLTSPLVTPGGRLTLSSAVPVMTADSTTSTTLYYLPYTSDIVPIYNGATWDQWQFTSLSLALDATAHPAGSVFDIAAINDAGTRRLVALPAYSALNARSAAVSRCNGLLVNSATVTCSYGSSTVSVPANRATILGTVRMTSNGSITYAPVSDAASAPCRLSVCNLYNSVAVTARLILSTSSYTVTGSLQAWNAPSTGSNACIETVNCDQGAIGVRIPVQLTTTVSMGAAGNIFRIAVGWDSKTSRVSNYAVLIAPVANYQFTISLADSITQAGSNGVGAHYIAPLEWAAAGTATISGNGYAVLTATVCQ